MNSEFPDFARCWSVVETDNFGGDYPNESFLIRHVKKDTAKSVADAINKDRNEFEDASRYYKVVEDTLKNPYKLRPGFEP